jgi:iron complex outermembrane receptor protein
MVKTSLRYAVPALVVNMAVASAGMAQDSAGSAQAETPAANPPAWSKDQPIQEVVVTSQRRAMKVQDVPIAETVLTGDQLKDKAVVRLADLAAAAPALTVADAGLTSFVNIRGIGLASGSPQVANGVATYIDGLFQPPIVSTSTFYDIANIEVLRGPQGTLVGSNSTGGAVMITTNNPNLNRLGGYAELGVGNHSAKSVEGALNVPLSDTLALRIAGNKRKRDSFYTDHGPLHNDPGKLDENAGRLGVLFKPGKFQALFKLDYLDKKTGGAAYKPIPGSANDVGVTGGIYDLNYNSPTKYDQHALINGLELRYETDSGIVLRSLTGYQDKKVRIWWDSDATTVRSNFSDQYVRERQKSQEFNIISPTTGQFNWILGAYYQQNLIDVAILQTGGSAPTNIEQNNKKRTTGVFAQTGYKLTDTLDLEFGMRESKFSASGAGGVYVGRGLPNFPAGGLRVSNLAGNYDDSKPTGKLSLNWKADQNNLLYGFVARGYKPGNYISATTKFAPETVMNYELGWKSSSADKRIRTQFDVFYNDYKNFQLDVLDPVTGRSNPTNLPPSTVKGFEGQIQARLGGFRVDGGFAYVDSKLGATNLVDAIALPGPSLGPQCAAGVKSNPPVCFNYAPFMYANSGGPNLLSPKVTYNAGVDYKFDLPNDMSLTPRLNLAHVSGSYFYATYRPDAYMPGHTTLSGLVTLRTGDWVGELYGNNLTDKHYIVGSANNNLFYSAPREFGVRVTREF